MFLTVLAKKEEARERKEKKKAFVSIFRVDAVAEEEVRNLLHANDAVLHALIG